MEEQTIRVKSRRPHSDEFRSDVVNLVLKSVRLKDTLAAPDLTSHPVPRFNPARPLITGFSMNKSFGPIHSPYADPNGSRMVTK